MVAVTLKVTVEVLPLPPLLELQVEGRVKLPAPQVSAVVLFLASHMVKTLA